MGVEENKAKLAQIFEIFSSGDTSKLGEIVAPGAIDHEVPPGIEGNGPEVVARVIEMFRAAFPDIKVEVQHMVGEDDIVMAHYRMTGTQRGDFMGIPATNKPIDINGVDIVRFENGLGAEHWGVSQDVAMLTQLGVIELPQST